MVNFMYAVALGGAALYAVGAAAVLFAAEREEKTIEFLSLLPSGPWPIFGGKISAAAASALALACALTIVAFVLAGGRFPGGGTMAEITAILGVGVLEMLVWGVLCSMLSKRPLVAALLGIFLASCGVAAAVVLGEPTAARRNMSEAYVKAVPYRLVLVALVGMVDVYLARHWLRGRMAVKRAAGSQGRSRVGSGSEVHDSAGSRPPLAWIVRLRDLASGGRTAAESLHQKPPALPILGRLIWQSWRQSRRMIGLVLGIAVVAALLFSFAFQIDDSTEFGPICGFIALLGACFMGAMTFLPDQERHRYAFFAERAERPRLVWLSRLTVWGGSAMLFNLVVDSVWAVALRYRHVQIQRDQLIGIANNHIGWSQEEIVYQMAMRFAGREQFMMVLAIVISIVVCGFAVGQFSSMMIRSGVMAGFWAAVLTAIGTAWIVLITLAVQTSPWWTAGPLVLALFVATWWRAPGWILGRRRIRSWILPIAVVLGTWTFVGVGTAWYRVAQIPNHGLDAVAATIEEYRNVDEREAEETIAMYRDAAARVTPQRFYPDKSATIPFPDVVEPKPVESEGAMGGYGRGMGMGYGGGMGRGGGMGNGEPVGSWSPEDAKKVDDYNQQLRAVWLEENRDVIALVIEASKRSDFATGPREGRVLYDSYGALWSVVRNDGDRLKAERDFSAALERFLTLLRIGQQEADRQFIGAWSHHALFHRTQLNGFILGWATAPGQTPENLKRAIDVLDDSSVRPRKIERQAGDRQNIDTWTVRASFQRTQLSGFILGWAAAPGQTPENLKRAIDALDDSSVRPRKPAYALITGYYKIRDIILGDEPPSFLNDDESHQEEYQVRNWTAFTLNRLPWERARALRLLDASLVEALSELEDVETVLIEPIDGLGNAGRNMRRFADHRWRVNLAGLRTRDRMRLATWIETTTLLADEIQRHMDSYSLLLATVNYEVRHRTLQLQLALIAWHLEHGEYPERLEKLVPEYFDPLPRDPYDDGPFRYLPHGYARENLDIPDDAAIRTMPVLWSVGRYDHGRRAEPWYSSSVDENGETEDAFLLPELPVEPAP